ncbi:hypothetical protein OH77DRAFT_1515813 [Trametes cingulata]|nr:hypothetical protein OH77DRAFT_1515813 [Trametes cingulata]
MAGCFRDHGFTSSGEEHHGPSTVDPSAPRSGPFATLIPELLNEVFHILRDDAIGFRWVKAISTCYHWRQVAINSPTLWSEVCIAYGSRSAMLHTALRRSMQVPLDISIWGIGDRDDLQLASHLLGPHVKRLRSLTIEFDLEAAGAVNMFLEEFGSCLTSLTLMAEHAGELDPRSNLEALHLPPLPNLRRLSIRGVVCILSDDALARLTSMEMSDLSKFGIYSSRWPFGQYILRTLSSCTNLQRLALSDVFSPADLHSSRVLHFPYAKEAHLREVEVDTARVLPYFSFPSNATVTATSVFNSGRWEKWKQDRSVNGVLKFALPPPPVAKPGEPLHPGPTSAYFRAVDREFRIGGYVGQNGTPYVGIVDVRRYDTRDHGRMMMTALANFRDLVDTSTIVDLEFHLAPYLGPRAISWSWVSHTFRPVHTLTVGGVYAVASFLDEACAKKMHSIGIKDLTFCLHDITLPVAEAFRRCAQKTQELGERIIAPEIKIRLPQRLEASDADMERLSKWASEMSPLVKIKFCFEHCDCCSRMVDDDRIQLALEDTILWIKPGKNVKEKARKVRELLERLLRECSDEHDE